MNSNIDYKQLGISDELNELFELMYRFNSFKCDLKKFMNDNEFWYDSVVNCVDYGNMYEFDNKIEEFDEYFKGAVRAIWNYETKRFF